MKRLANVMLLVLAAVLSGCVEKQPPYGTEATIRLRGAEGQVWAVAPAVNLSGEQSIDPLLQADLVYQQLQQVRGLTVIPVNRVVEVYVALGIDSVQSQEKAAIVCDVLGADALLIPSVTIYDPFNPPKLGAALQLFGPQARPVRQTTVSPRELARSAAPAIDQPMPVQVEFVQAVGIYDAANGSVRTALEAYARGRYEPAGPLGLKEYYVNMDRYCGFVYHELIRDLLKKQAGRG